MQLAHFFAEHSAVIHIRLTEVRGSSPREAGAEMFVSAQGLFGTIGGGQLEYMVIDQARAMLRTGQMVERMNVSLGPEIGQCCGGRVALTLTHMSEADRKAVCAEQAQAIADYPHVYILGAGHVGRALACLFQFLPVRCILIDNRREELALCDAKVETRLTAMAETDIRIAPPGSVFIVLTHDHALDFLLTSEALNRGDAAYVGLIGSATKRAKFNKFHQINSLGKAINGLTCPIGVNGSADKRPEIIAIFVVAEIMARLTVTAGLQLSVPHQQNEIPNWSPVEGGCVGQYSREGTQNV